MSTIEEIRGAIQNAIFNGQSGFVVEVETQQMAIYVAEYLCQSGIRANFITL
jgi:hypothetical protein